MLELISSAIRNGALTNSPWSGINGAAFCCYFPCRKLHKLSLMQLVHVLQVTLGGCVMSTLMIAVMLLVYMDNVTMDWTSIHVNVMMDMLDQCVRYGTAHTVLFEVM